MLRIEALGGLAIRYDDDLLDGRIQRRQQSLLLALAAAGERGVSRDKLLALLWPESPDENARHSLKQTIYLLRRALNDSEVVLGRGVLRLNPDFVTSDLGDFDAAMARGDFAAAASLYRGPLLDGVHLFDTPEWEHWVDAARDHYARQYLDALNALAEEREARGSPEEAVASWRGLARADPYSARVAVRLMQALERAGDQAAALRVADEYGARLRQELEAEPDAEVAALAERIRREPRPHVAPARAISEIPAPSPAPADDTGDPPSSSDGAGSDVAMTEDGRARPRRFNRSRLAVGLVIVAIVGALPLLSGGRVDGRGDGADEGAVAVLPFRVDAPDPSLAYLREGLMDLLASLLTGEGVVHALDTRTVLAAVRDGRGRAGDLPRAQALRLARDLGAGQVLLGEVVGIPGNGGRPRLILSASIVQVGNGRDRVQARAEGSADSLGVLVERLAGQLLFGESGDAEHRAPAALTASLPALRAYLAGQAADRRFDGEAVDHFLRALELDSTFALAALRLHLALSWAADRRVPQGIGERALWIAWNHRDRLSPRDQAILTVRLGPRFPALTGIPGILAYQEDAVRRFPEVPEIWLELAETYFHSGALLGMTDWRERFKAAAENALRLDPDHTRREALPHLIAVYTQEGDTARVRQLRQLRGVGAPPEQAVPVAAPEALRRGDSARAADWRTLLDTLPLPALDGIVRLRLREGAAARAAEAADAVLRRAATPGERNGALSQQAVVALARGRPAAALRARRALLDAAQDERARRGVLVTMIYDALYQDGSRVAAASAADELERLLDGGAAARPAAAGMSPAKDSARSAESAAARSLQACALEQWRLANGDTRTVRGHLAALHAPPPAVPPFSPLAVIPFRQRICVALLQAWAATAQNAPDVDTLLDRADLALRTELPLWLIGYPELAAGNIGLARLYARRGRMERALAAIQRNPNNRNVPFYAVAFAREEARLARAAGERAQALQAYRYYLALRADPEPELRPEADAMRAELARLLAERTPLAHR